MSIILQKRPPEQKKLCAEQFVQRTILVVILGMAEGSADSDWRSQLTLEDRKKLVAKMCVYILCRECLIKIYQSYCAERLRN